MSQSTCAKVNLIQQSVRNPFVTLAALKSDYIHLYTSHTISRGLSAALTSSSPAAFLVLSITPRHLWGQLFFSAEAIS